MNAQENLELYRGNSNYADGEFDEAKIDLDNNRDIDLTNDYKQSAIGLSALIKIPEKLKITITDMGVYHNLKNDINNELLTICLFVSKFAKDSKSYLWFKENYSLINDQRTSTLQFLEKLFDVKESRIKNIEDYFDKFFSGNLNKVPSLVFISHLPEGK